MYGEIKQRLMVEEKQYKTYNTKKEDKWNI